MKASLLAHSLSLRHGLTVLLALAAPAVALAQTAFDHDPNGNRYAQTAADAFAPTIRVPPAHQVAQLGGTARFGVIAAGSGPFNYQWFRDATPIVGATSDTLTLSNLAAGQFTPGPGGTPRYSVRVTNASGNVTSASAALYLDTDGGGLPDWWQLQNFGALGVSPGGDADGDGVSNLREYLDGTLPNSRFARSGRLLLGPATRTDAAPRRSVYPEGSSVFVRAYSFGESQFGGWTGSARSLSNPLNFTFRAGDGFPGDAVLTALFGSLPPDTNATAPAFTNFNGNPAQATTLAAAPDGSVIVLGAFDLANGTLRNGVARIRPDGTLDPSFAPNFNGAVTCALILPDGRVVLGGSFSLANAVVRPGLARFQADGTLDPTFAPADPGNNASQVKALALQRDGKLLVGGTVWADVGFVSLVRLLPDGSRDVAFTPPGLSAPVTALAVQPDAHILVSGSFTNTASLIRLLPHGPRESNGTFDQQVGLNGAATTLIVQPDGKILAGGGLLTIGNLVFSPVMRLTTGGFRDEPFCSNATNLLLNQPGTGVALQDDGRVVVTGNFASANPQLTNVLRLNANGTVDASAFAVSRTNAAAQSVTALSDGSVAVGGSFTRITADASSPANGRIYVLTSGRMTWPEAEAQAVAMGGHLVTIRNQAENDYLANVFLPASGLGNVPVWLGLSDHQVRGLYAWSSGEPVTFTNWRPSEPSATPGEYFAVLGWGRALSSGFAAGGWDDVLAAGTQGFGGATDGPYYGIIELDPAAVAPSSVDWIAGRDLALNERDDRGKELTNPNATVPVWSYGTRTIPTGTGLALFTDVNHTNNGYNSGGAMQGWLQGYAGVLVNTSAFPTAAQGSYTSVFPGELVLQPFNTFCAVVRWTAPTAGTFMISAFWQQNDRGGGDGASAHLVVNGAQLDGRVFDRGGGHSTHQVLTLNAGDLVDFVVGPRGDDTYDTVRFNALIRQAVGGPAQTWVAGRDLKSIEKPDGDPRETSNPNALVPEWSYGYRNTPVANAFTLFTPAQHLNSFLGTGNDIDGYNTNEMSLAVNTSSQPVFLNNGLPLNPGDLFLGPEHNAVNVPVLRWTAPRAGTYDVLASWQDNDPNGGNGITAHLVINGAQAAAATLDNGAGASLARTVVLQAGDRLDFVIGARGDYGFDSTSCNVAILGVGPAARPAASEQVNAVDELTRTRLSYARFVPTNHIVPGPLAVSPAGPIYAAGASATFTVSPTVPDIFGDPDIVSVALESSSDGFRFQPAGVEGTRNGGNLWTLALPAQAPGTTFYRAVVTNGNQEVARTFAVGPLTTPPALTSPNPALGLVAQPFSYQATATGPLTAFTAGNLPAWAGASYDPNTGVLTLTGNPPGAGVYHATLTPANAAGGTPTNLAILIANTFGAWQNANFTAGELGNPAVSGPTADPLGSGISNLLRYALGIPARRPGSVGLPVVSAPSYAGTRYLTLTYTRDQAATDVSLVVQVCGNLATGGVGATWSDGPGFTTEVSRTDNGDGTETVVTRDNVPLTGTTHRFVRLQATR